MTDRMREIGKGLAACAALVLLVVGPPLVLVAGVGWPLPQQMPTWSEVGDALGGSAVSDAALLKALACGCWVLWLLVVMSTIEELLAWARGRSARRVPAGGALQPLVRQLVMTATLLAAAARTSSAPVTLPPAAPAVAVVEPAAAQEATPQRAVDPALPSCLVQPRDSLWKLAEDHLGDGLRWRELWELNRGKAQPDGRMFEDPNLIHPGWILKMPADAVGLEPAAGSSPPAVAPAAQPPPVISPSSTTTTTVTPATTTTAIADTNRQPGPDAATSDDNPDDPDFEVVPILAGAALVAAGVVGAIDRLRRRQLRHRSNASLRLPWGPERHVETSLRHAANTGGYSLLDLALRNLAHQLGAADERERPRIDVVSVGPAGIEVLLDRATAAPSGPFEVAAAGQAWTLPATVDEALLVSIASDEPGPVPALVTVGTVDDRSVLLDLESSPCTVVNGDPADARALLWTVAVDLATSSRADDIDLLVIGDTPRGFDALDRVRRAARIVDVLPDLERHVRSTKALLAAEGFDTAFDARLACRGDGMAPTVVLMDAGERAGDHIERLIHLARQRAGVAVILTGEVPAPDRELCVEDDTLIVKPLGLRLTPGALPDHVVAAATGLITAASEDHDCGPTSIDLRESVASRDVVVSYDADGVPILPDGHVLVRVFGGVEVFGGARPIDRRRCTELVVFLALHPEGVDEERLREALWPESNPTRSAFNETVSRARRCLGLDPTGLPHVRHMARGLYQVGPYVHVEQKRAGAGGSVPFQGCRGYEWAYSEGIAYALEAPIEADSRSA